MSDMRFVIHCALLLLAFVGLATIVDRCTAPAGDEDSVNLSARQLASVDDSKTLLPVAPLVVFAFGLAALAVYRSKMLSRRWKKAMQKCYLVFSLKGWDMTAQGNALGRSGKGTEALKGRNKRLPRTLSRPFRAIANHRRPQGDALACHALPFQGMGQR